MTENKRFIYCFEGIEDKWETVEEYKYTPCTKDGFQDLCTMLNDLNDENEQLKQEVTRWKKILDNHQQIVAKTLREQYHWLKNEDKIQNNDKTVALLELESISERLGIDLN